LKEKEPVRGSKELIRKKPAKTKPWVGWEPRGNCKKNPQKEKTEVVEGKSESLIGVPTSDSSHLTASASSKEWKPNRRSQQKEE